MRFQFLNINSAPGLALGVLSTLFISIGSFAQQSILKAEPMGHTVEVGEEFEVTLKIDPDGDTISVADVYMSFDPQYLEVVAMEQLEGPLSNTHIGPEYNNSEGKLQLGAFRLQEPFATEEFSFVKITFSALEPTPQTQIRHELNNFPRTVLAFEGANKLESLNPVDVTILGTTVGDDELEAKPFLTVSPTVGRGQVDVSFRMLKPSKANVQVLDANGRHIDVLYSGDVQPGKTYRFQFDGTQLATGQYMIRLITDGERLVRDFVIAR